MLRNEPFHNKLSKKKNDTKIPFTNNTFIFCRHASVNPENQKNYLFPTLQNSCDFEKKDWWSLKKVYFDYDVVVAIRLDGNWMVYTIVDIEYGDTIKTSEYK